MNRHRHNYDAVDRGCGCGQQHTQPTGRSWLHERNAGILRLRQTGATLAHVGTVYGISAQQVRNITQNHKPANEVLGATHQLELCDLIACRPMISTLRELWPE